MAITSETLLLSAEQRAALSTITDKHTTALVGAWVRVWDSIGPEFEQAVDSLFLAAVDGRVSRTRADRSQRLAAALQLAQGRLNDLADGVELTVADDLPSIVELAYKGQTAMMVSQLPLAATVSVAGWDKITAGPVDAMVKRTLGTIHKATRPLADDVVAAMKTELVRGIAVGDNPHRTAQRIIRNTEGRFNGGLTRALTVARTEALDMHREAGQMADLANPEIMRGWAWGAELSARTCPSCLANHGTEHPIEEPGPLDHHQGRCARIPLTKSWAELGFKDVAEPPSLMRDSREWFDGLTSDMQRSIMGPERLNLLQSGQIGWSDLTTRAKNGEWRGSMIVTPVKDLWKG